MRAPSGCGRATPVRIPKLKIAMSEGGIGWVAMLLDRLDNIIDRSGYGLGWDERPADVLQAQLLVLHHRRPVDDRHPPPHRRREHHGRSRTTRTATAPGPTPSSCIEKAWGHIPADELRMMCSENAARLYRHPLPRRSSRATERQTSREFHPDRRETHPGHVDARGTRPAGALPVERGLLRPPRRPHHVQPRRRHPAVQPVAHHLERAASRAGHPHRPRRQPARGRLAGAARHPAAPRSCTSCVTT